MLKKAVLSAWSFVQSHPLVCVVGIVSIPAGAALLAYQRQRAARPKPPKVYPPVRDAVDEPVAAPSIDELPVFTKDGAPWMH